MNSIDYIVSTRKGESDGSYRTHIHHNKIGGLYGTVNVSPEIIANGDIRKIIEGVIKETIALLGELNDATPMTPDTFPSVSAK